MSVSSEDSLTELPLPFDISYAVSRALRISEQPGIGAPDAYSYPDRNRFLAGYDVGQAHENMAIGSEACCPTIYPSCVQDYHPHPPYYHCSTPLAPGFPNDQSALLSSYDSAVNLMNVSSSSSIEQFYELSDLAAQSGPTFNSRSQSCSYGHFYTESCTSPRKRRRNTIQYCNDPKQLSVDDLDNSDHYSDWPWTACLDNNSLWTKFDEIGTEMVVTKGGRRMFPHLEVSFQNLDPTAIYSVNFEIHPCDGKRYKFLKTEWVPTGRAEKKQTPSIYEHPDSPNSGSYWMSKPTTFKMVKLTNNKMTKYRDQIILNSMQKYQPLIRLTDEKMRASKSFTFPETTFIAVTAYQNNLMTQMKIDHNPYARAFREGDQSGLHPEKKGGHYERFRKSSSTSPSHKKRGKSSSIVCSNSATSMDSAISGSEGSRVTVLSTEKASPLLVADETVLMSSLSASNSLSYWADDNSLWNPNLISPDPLMDSTNSFSEPFLRQTTQVELVCDVNPVDGLFDGDQGFFQLQEPHTACILDSVSDDDVFL